MNIGIIGTGSIAEHHIKAYRGNKDVTLYAFCDLNAERAKEKAVKYGAAHVYTDYRELLANPDVDAVSICTWNNSHAEISIAALEAGKNVLVEKPLTKSMEEAYRVQETVRRTGKLLQVGFVRRFASNAQVLKKFIDDGTLGEIYYAKASCLRRNGNPGGWFADVERSGGGPLIDLGVHVIDLCWYMMGKPKVTAVSGNTYKKLGNRANVEHLAGYRAADYDPNQNGVEDLANALIRFENGATLMIDVSFTLHAKENEMNVKLYGDKGGAEIEPELVMVTEQNNTILNVNPQISHREFHFPEAFQNEINHFVNCCKTGSQPLAGVDDGVELMKILCGIYESAQSGREIVFARGEA
jgi:predicted dehydrogenase